MTDYDGPNTWLESGKRDGFISAAEPYTHPEDPDFDQHVRERATELRVRTTCLEHASGHEALRQTPSFPSLTAARQRNGGSDSNWTDDGGPSGGKSRR